LPVTEIDYDVFCVMFAGFGAFIFAGKRSTILEEI
jgi:hypothetical protein